MGSAARTPRESADFSRIADRYDRARERPLPVVHFVHGNEGGAFRNTVRRRFEELADRLGYRERYRGVTDRVVLEECFRSRGCGHARLDPVGLRWETAISYRQALEDFKDRLFAEFWGIPDDRYADMIVEGEEWIVAQPAGPDATEAMAPWLEFDVFAVPRPRSLTPRSAASPGASPSRPRSSRG